MASPLNLKTISIRGAQVAYREEGGGEPVLYLHGFPSSGYLWRQVMGEVARSYRTIAPDFPSFGDSAPRAPHTWEALIGWTDELVDALEIAPVHLGVHDWGGLIGLAWATIHPEKVRSLLITDTTFRSRDRWHALAAQWRTPGVGEQLIGEITEYGFRSFVSLMAPLDDETIAEYWKGLSTPDRRAAKLELYRSLDFEMLAPLELKLPEVAPGRVLIVWGEQDPVLPVKVAFWFGSKLGADVKVIEGAGHFLQEQRGAEIGRLHREFMDSLR